MMKPIRLASTLALMLAVPLCPSVATAQQAEPPAAAQVRAGDALMTQGQYAQAAHEYEAAYAVDPDLAILERLAEAYRMSGDAARAAAIDARIAQLRARPPAPYVPPAPPPTYVPPPPPAYVPASPLPSPVYTYTRPSPARRAGQSLINTGVGLLIAGYGIGLVGGGITMGATYALDSNPSWYGAGGMLMIPLAGPFATAVYNSNYWWVAPWAVISGGMQLSGLALAIAGGVVRAQHKPTTRASAAKELPFMISPYASAQGSGLSVAGRF